MSKASRANRVAKSLLEADEQIDPRKFILSTRMRRGPGHVNLGGWIVNAVKSSTGEWGTPTGGVRRCSCGSGLRFGVRWPDGKITWLCTKALTFEGPVAIIPN